MKLLWSAFSLFFVAVGRNTCAGAGAPVSVIHNLARGSALKMVGDLTGGLPFEVWKSTLLLELRRAHAAGEEPLSSLECLKRILKTHGAAGLWSGCSARMLEGALSGGVLLAGSQAIQSCLKPLCLHPPLVAFAAGAGGGACQALVMAPCSMMVLLLCGPFCAKVALTRLHYF
jgi:hypothetical protein